MISNIKGNLGIGPPGFAILDAQDGDGFNFDQPRQLLLRQPLLLSGGTHVQVPIECTGRPAFIPRQKGIDLIYGAKISAIDKIMLNPSRALVLLLGNAGFPEPPVA